MAKKKGKVKPHTRYDPRLSKRVNVGGYERKQKVKQFNKNIQTKQPLAKGLTAENLGYIEYKIIELIKLNDHYDQPTTMYELNDELAFGDEDKDVILEKVQNLMSQGILNIERKDKSFKPTKVGNRVFWEFYKKNDDGDHLDHLKDNPKMKKMIEEEGFEVIGKTKYPNETILYLKDLNKEVKQIDKQLKESIKFKKQQKKKEDSGLKFIYYTNGEIELVEKEKGKIKKYIASWSNETEFKKSLKEMKK